MPEGGVFTNQIQTSWVCYKYYLNHAVKYIYKSVFNNHHCIYIEKKKCE